MFVSNLANHPLGVDGTFILKPLEQNRFIEDTEDLVERVKRLQSVGLVEAKFEEGLEKNGLPTEQVVEATPAVEEVVAEATEVETTEVVPANEEAPAKNKRGAGRGNK